MALRIIFYVDSEKLFTQGYRQAGKARVSESRMRWFESSYPCHMSILHCSDAVLFWWSKLWYDESGYNNSINYITI